MKLKTIIKEYDHGKGLDTVTEDGSLGTKTTLMGVNPNNVKIDILPQDTDKVLLKHKPIKNKEKK